jgi:hypothetical protein
LISVVLTMLLSVPVAPHTPTAQHAPLVQPAPAPITLIVYNQKGEQVATCKITDDGETITGCKIQDGFTLDDLMTAWADAVKRLEESK